MPIDYSTGFGGKYGVQKDRIDKNAVGFDYQEKVEKHESQKGKNLYSNLYIICEDLKYGFLYSSQIVLCIDGH